LGNLLRKFISFDERLPRIVMSNFEIALRAHLVGNTRVACKVNGFDKIRMIAKSQTKRRAFWRTFVLIG